MSRRLGWWTVTFTLIALFSAAHPILDPDMWWHIAAGGEILRRRTLFFVDPFSFTHQAVWVNSQWLSEVVFTLIHRFSGVIGLELLTLALKVIAFLLTFAAMEAPPLTRVWLTLLFGLGAFPVMGGARPQLLSSLALSAIAWWLHRQRRQMTDDQSSMTQFVWLPMVFAVWANTHSFYPVAWTLLVLAIVADWWNERKEWKPTKGAKWRKQMAIMLLLCLPAVMLTPFGWHSVKQVLVNIAQSSQLPIEEWKPVTAMRHPLVFIWCGLLLLWVGCVAWSPKRMDALEFLWGSFLTVSAFSGVRMIVVWCLLMAPFVARHVEAMLERLSGTSPPLPYPTAALTKEPPRWLPTAVTTLCALLALLIIAIKFSPDEFAKSERKEYPQQAVAWMQKRNIMGNCLTRYDWGGYVSWQLRGKVLVFVDGRADFYPLKVMRDFMTVYYGGKRWRQVLNRYGVTLVLVPLDAPIANLLQLSRDRWRRVYQDNQAVLFVRQP